MDAPDVRYTTAADGVEIAYAVLGEGTPTLVYVPGFISHLDLQWAQGPHMYFPATLAQIGPTVTFDKRGTGLSERTIGYGSLEERAEDLRAVFDATGIEQADILGVSEGGPMAVFFAAQNPERVRSLVLYGTFRRLPDPQDIRGFSRRRFEDLRAGWGDGQLIGWIVGEDDPDLVAAFGAYERSACTPAMAAEIMRSNFEIDVDPILGSVTVPSLVVHCTGDHVVPIGEGRALAQGISGAEFEELSLDLHTPLEPEPIQPALETIVEYLRRDRQGTSERVLASVLFTDIVGSTEKATAMGDRAWAALLDRHDELARTEVERLGGSVVKTTGDGLLALFDSPSKAIEGARSITHAVEPLGIEVRAGVHTGEVERRGDDVGGIGVHIGARVAGLAGTGEVLVSRTVRDLTLGSQIEFVDRGRHALKGVPNEWELFAVTA